MKPEVRKRVDECCKALCDRLRRKGGIRAGNVVRICGCGKRLKGTGALNKHSRVCARTSEARVHAPD